MTFMEFLRTDLGVRDWLTLVTSILTFACLMTAIIARSKKMLGYFLLVGSFAFVSVSGTFQYHKINYDMHNAQLLIEEEDYMSALYIYKKLLNNYPDLPRVIDARNKCLKEMTDENWLELKEDFNG